MKRDPVAFPFADGEGGAYSGLRVLRSGAGYYLGRMHWDPDLGGFVQPGSRESSYWPDEASAAAALATMRFELRDCAENESLYSSGIVARPEVVP
jgi:hypothetical protein